MENFVEYIEEEVRRLYEKFTQKPMIELTHALKRKHEAVKKCRICLKEFLSIDLDNKKVRDHCHYTGLYRGGQPTINAT